MDPSYDSDQETIIFNPSEVSRYRSVVNHSARRLGNKPRGKDAVRPSLHQIDHKPPLPPPPAAVREIRRSRDGQAESPMDPFSGGSGSGQKQQSGRTRQLHHVTTFRIKETRYSRRKLHVESLDLRGRGMMETLARNRSRLMFCWEREIFPRTSRIPQFLPSPTWLHPDHRAPSPSIGSNICSLRAVVEVDSPTRSWDEEPLYRGGHITCSPSLRIQKREINGEYWAASHASLDSIPGDSTDVFATRRHRPTSPQPDRAWLRSPDHSETLEETKYITSDYVAHRCKTLLLDGKCYKRSCSRVHSYPRDDNIVCKLYLQGKCFRNNKCWYKHPHQETKVAKSSGDSRERRGDSWERRGDSWERKGDSWERRDSWKRNCDSWERRGDSRERRGNSRERGGDSWERRGDNRERRGDSRERRADSREKRGDSWERGGYSMENRCDSRERGDRRERSTNHYQARKEVSQQGNRHMEGRRERNNCTDDTSFIDLASRPDRFDKERMHVINGVSRDKTNRLEGYTNDRHVNRAQQDITVREIRSGAKEPRRDYSRLLCVIKEEENREEGITMASQQPIPTSVTQKTNTNTNQRVVDSSGQSTDATSAAQTVMLKCQPVLQEGHQHPSQESGKSLTEIERPRNSSQPHGEIQENSRNRKEHDGSSSTGRKEPTNSRAQKEPKERSTQPGNRSMVMEGRSSREEHNQSPLAGREEPGNATTPQGFTGENTLSGKINKCSEGPRGNRDTDAKSDLHKNQEEQCSLESAQCNRRNNVGPPSVALGLLKTQETKKEEEHKTHEETEAQANHNSVIEEKKEDARKRKRESTEESNDNKRKKMVELPKAMPASEKEKQGHRESKQTPLKQQKSKESSSKKEKEESKKTEVTPQKSGTSKGEKKLDESTKLKEANKLKETKKREEAKTLQETKQLEDGQKAKKLQEAKLFKENKKLGAQKLKDEKKMAATKFKEQREFVAKKLKEEKKLEAQKLREEERLEAKKLRETRLQEKKKSQEKSNKHETKTSEERKRVQDTGEGTPNRKATENVRESQKATPDKQVKQGEARKDDGQRKTKQEDNKKKRKKGEMHKDDKGSRKTITNPKRSLEFDDEVPSDPKIVSPLTSIPKRHKPSYPEPITEPGRLPQPTRNPKKPPQLPGDPKRLPDSTKGPTTPDPTKNPSRLPDLSRDPKRLPNSMKGPTRTLDPTQGPKKLPDPSKDPKRTSNSVKDPTRSFDPSKDHKRLPDPCNDPKRLPDPTKDSQRLPDSTCDPKKHKASVPDPTSDPRRHLVFLPDPQRHPSPASDPSKHQTSLSESPFGPTRLIDPTNTHNRLPNPTSNPQMEPNPHEIQEQGVSGHEWVKVKQEALSPTHETDTQSSLQRVTLATGEVLPLVTVKQEVPFRIPVLCIPTSHTAQSLTVKSEKDPLDLSIVKTEDAIFSDPLELTGSAPGSSVTTPQPTANQTNEDFFSKTEPFLEEEFNPEEEALKEQQLMKHTREFVALGGDSEGLPPKADTPEALYNLLKKTMHEINCDVWEEDIRFTFNWEANLRRLAVNIFQKDNLEHYTRNIRQHMASTPSFTTFLRDLIRHSNVK